MELNRRSFLKLSAACAGITALSATGCAPQTLEEKGEGTEAPKPSESPITEIRTTCGNCHNDCGVIINIQDGVIAGCALPERPSVRRRRLFARSLEISHDTGG